VRERWKERIWEREKGSDGRKKESGRTREEENSMRLQFRAKESEREVACVNV